MKNSFLQFDKSLSVPKEEKEPVVFDFQDPSPPPMKAVNMRTAHHAPIKGIKTHVFSRVEQFLLFISARSPTSHLLGQSAGSI